ncbi:MAG: GH92 family glycosyl hydrolase, partial [Cyclobacteriaceae bacterium]|nr:GH92 family glycosyl hydrolase [Cyclobacteriaceae bacterium]
DYSDVEVYFFSCMRHMSGYPHGSSGQIIIQPIENADSFQLNKDSRPFSHQNENAEPGYYKLEFDDNGTVVETTATTRSGMFRFSYENSIKPKIFIGDIGTVELGEGGVIRGTKRNILIKFNTIWSKAEKTNEGIILTFDEPENKTILLKLSSSSVSFQNTQENLDAEIPDWDFDGLKIDTQNAWKDQLSVIEVSDSSVDNKTKFYSALYHSLLIPWIVSDVNKEYKGRDHKIYKAKGTDHYGAFSPWDTFRSLHPLISLIAPNRQNVMIVSMLEIYEQTGQLPVQPMTGYHSIPIIVDSYFKNITNFDKSLAYEAMKECIVNEPFFYEDMLAYIQKGYIPASYPESVTRTIEYAYNDWVLSQYAKIVMNESEDYLQLFNRSLNYRNLFDPQQMFLVPRGDQGFLRSNSNFGFKEGDKWNYSFFIPHNPRDIINLMGSNEEFSNLLDSAIRNGHIIFDNEPNFHIPYLFNYSKSTSKTQEWISDIRETYFSSTESGLPGNDDLGSMSSWFVFNALGFYPVCPGIPEYNIGTPLFEEVTIHSGGNKKFVIKGYDASSENKYIQAATLNGENLDRSWISHSSIVSGGLLNFKMGSKPSDWAKKSSSAGYSATKKEV